MALSLLNPMSSSFILAVLLNVILASITHTQAAPSADYLQPTTSDNLAKRSIPSDADKAHLLQLLAMRDAISKALPAEDDMSDIEDLMESPLAKRVFCNEFSGCGGKFRGDRGRFKNVKGFMKGFTKGFMKKHPFMKKHIISTKPTKRPFCNQLGCYNGRKRDGDVTPDLNELVAAASKVPDMSALRSNLDERVKKFLNKKLFCNSYAGCMNGRKKDWDSGTQEPSTLPLADQSWENMPKNKRFFAGGFDNDMQSFIDGLKR